MALLIVDTSYVIFAKYFATLHWYKNSVNRIPDIPDLFNIAVFRNKFGSMFNNCIYRLLERHGMPHRNSVVFAQDCSRDSVWRKDVFSAYKDGRTHNSNFNRDAFREVYASLIPQWIAQNGGCAIGAERAEADDVIGVLHDGLRSTRPTVKMVILTNDNDCIQLVDTHTTVVNVLFEDVGDRRGYLTPDQYLTCRILSGDRSDNIPGSLPRCGMRTAVRLVSDASVDRSGVEECKYCYDRNDVLMNLKHTPEAIREKIRTAFEAAIQQGLLDLDELHEQHEDVEHGGLD